MANLSIIRKICDEKKWSLKKLAEILEISENGLQRILKTNSTKIETLERIAEILDISIITFFQESSDIDFEIKEFRKSELIILLSNRYEKITDRISFLLDSYIWEVINKINISYIPSYPFKHPTRPKSLLNTHEEISSFTYPYSNTLPFSRWPLEEQNKILKYGFLLEGFYFSIFTLNLYNIENYLYDGFIQDKELLKYWEMWKQIRTEIEEVLWKF